MTKILYGTFKKKRFLECEKMSSGETVPHFLTAIFFMFILLMKDGRAMGMDEISTEMIKALDEENIDTITKLCNIIYNTGYVPEEMKQSIFITIPKKPNTQKCTEFRTISLMSHISKLLLKVIQHRIVTKIENEVSKLQSGFRPGFGTREGIFNLRMIIERAIETQNDVYICFID